MARCWSVFALSLAITFIGCTTKSTGTAIGEAGRLPLEQILDVPVRAQLAASAGGSPRFDYAAVDDRRGLLYIAYLGANQVVVFDLNANKIVARIPNLQAVHGVLAVPTMNTVYASATGTNEIAVIDETTQRLKARVPGGDYPDGIAYDPVNHKIFVSDEAGGTDTVIDTRSNRRVDTIDLGGEVGNTQYDSAARRIFADVQTKNELVAVDPASDRVVARYALPGCVHDHGLYIDGARRLAFVACDGNAKLLVLDMHAMRVRAVFSVGKAPDVLTFDPGLRRLYVASESGVVSVFAENGTTLRKLGEAFLADEAHVVALDPRTHRVYFPLQNVDGRPVIRVMKPLLRRTGDSGE